MHTLEFTTDELNAVREALAALEYHRPGLSSAQAKVKAEIKRTESVLRVPVIAGIATRTSIRATTNGGRL